MVALSGIFSRIRSFKALVLGDLMLDSYTIGSVGRISPEAPVPVLRVSSEETRPGGAGNVALNLVSLGATVRMAGRVGQDMAGETLQSELRQEGIDTSGVIVSDKLPTPVKNRLIASNQQLMRVDNEIVAPLAPEFEEEFCKRLPELLDGIDVVAISDYAKGFLTRRILKETIELAREKKIPVLVDPKKGDWRRYRGATVIKPNESEAYEAAMLDASAPLDSCAEVLFSASEAEHLVITRSKKGISVFSGDGQREDHPVRVREVKDVTGAGDTVLATLTCGLASGLEIGEAVQLANIAAGMSIEMLGCARISLTDLARRLLEYDTVNKVFSDEHHFALWRALEERRYVVLGMPAKDGLSSSMYSSIRQLGREKTRDLILYISEGEVDAGFIQLLSSLQEVRFIVLNAESLHSLAERVPPDEVYYIENGGMKKLEQATELV